MSLSWALVATQRHELWALQSSHQLMSTHPISSEARLQHELRRGLQHLHVDVEHQRVEFRRQGLGVLGVPGHVGLEIQPLKLDTQVNVVNLQALTPPIRVRGVLFGAADGGR